MTSFVRPFVISLLCGMAAIGHAPAWLHVAGCEHESHPQLSSSATSIAALSCQDGCCHAADKTETSGERAAGEESSHSHDGHDSDSCVICQSLGVPTGVAWHLHSLAIERVDQEIVKISAVVTPESTFLSIPQPRGPPTRLA